MATHLDLEEQEQLAELRHFWKSYGNLITWVLIAVLGAFAAWNGYQAWQRNQAARAAALYDEVERFAQAGDLAGLERSLGDMKSKFGGTTYAQQTGLLAAQTFQDKGQSAQAKAALTWLADDSSDAGYRAVARLRLVALLVQEKAYDEALKQLAAEFPPGFAALVADRRGDVLSLQGKKADAAAEYAKALRDLDDQVEYRRLVEVKLNGLGVDPKASAAAKAGKTE